MDDTKTKQDLEYEAKLQKDVLITKCLFPLYKDEVDDIHRLHKRGYTQQSCCLETPV
ncbi:hypothetical protein Unana1_08717 [Umbelopsis nana]